MKSTESIFKLLGKLSRHINPNRRFQFILLLGFVFFTSLVEILSIGSVIPFLGILTSPEKLFELPLLQPIINLLNVKESKQLLLPLTLAFVIMAFLAGGMRLILLWATTRLSFTVGADISVEIYRRTLYQPYTVHCSRNTSEIISGISNKAKIVINIINMTLTLFSSSIMLFMILSALIILDPFVTSVIFLGLGLIYFLISLVVRKKLFSNSRLIAKESNVVVKSLQEGLGGIRDILIDGSQEVYCEIYRKADFALRDAAASNTFISSAPRYVVEALGMVLIATLAYVMTNTEAGMISVIPLLGALALGVQRLLPILQQGYSAWSTIEGGRSSLQDTLALLEQPMPSYLLESNNEERLNFNDSVCLKKVSYQYDLSSIKILNQIDMKISKGERVGIIGSTGCGKSTTLDIVMGLLKPTEGQLQVDGEVISSTNLRSWQIQIAHVPQVIFLSDASIEENIAFGVPKNQIDATRVRQAAERAQIHEIITQLPKQYKTIIGERGILLSGGQRQRIGIARALYKKSSLIIFDEATSALDGDTERAVIEAIDDLDKDLTIIMVAHRLSTLANCTTILELGSAGVKKFSSYEKMLEEKL
jgi:ATP-binding cassette subfamily B protein